MNNDPIAGYAKVINLASNLPFGRREIETKS